MAIAREQEMVAQIEESRAKLVDAEAEVPKAICGRHPQRHAGYHGLLQAAQRASRHRHAAKHRRQHRPADGASESGLAWVVF